MRVALDVSAIPAQPVGAGVYVLRLVGALADRGDVDLHLLSGTADAARWQSAAPAAVVHAEAPGPRAARLLWEQVRAPRSAGRLGADVWHGPHYTMPLRRPLPTAVTIHDLTLIEHPEWHERSKVLFFGAMIRAAARRADVLVCVSDHTARRLRARLRPRAPVVVVPHGVDHRRFRPGPVPGDDETLAAVGVRSPFVAFVGTVEPRKGVASLVAAVRRLGRPDLQLVLAGRHGWGARPPAGEDILRLDYVADDLVPALFRRAAAVAYPSLEEGFGLPALEALACGAPLVTTTGSAMQDVVGDAALLVPPGDEAALAEAIEALVGGGPAVERLRRRGPQVAAGFTWAASAEGHVAAYRLAMAARS